MPGIIPFLVARRFANPIYQGNPVSQPQQPPQQMAPQAAPQPLPGPSLPPMPAPRVIPQVQPTQTLQPVQNYPSIQPTNDAPAPSPQPASDSGDKGGGLGRIFSMFDQPKTTDKLAAFSAAMLGGDSFVHGFGNAVQAVNNVDREYRMPTDAEVARATLKSRLLQAATGRGSGHKPTQAKDIWYGPDGSTAFREIFDPNTGQTGFQNAQTGEMLTKLPPGSFQRVDSSIGENNKSDAKMLEEYRVAADEANNQYNSLQALEQAIPTAGVDQGVLADTKRQITKLLGREVFSGFNPADMTTVEKTLRDFELGLAKSQKGLGQFTEMERQIVKEALPQLDSNPEAFRRILKVMEAKAQRSQQVYNDWIDMDTEERAKYGSFRKYVVDFKKNYDSKWDADLKDAYGSLGQGSQTPASVRAGIAQPIPSPQQQERPGDKYLQ